MWMGWMLSAALAGPAPLFGVQWTPTAAEGEPAWAGYCGVELGRLDLLASVGVDRRQITTTVDEMVTQRHLGVVRPAMDVRFRFDELSRSMPVAVFAQAGIDVDIPSVRDTSDGFTEEEQDIADQSAAEERRSMQALGLRLGGGAWVPLNKAVAVGAQYTLTWRQRGIGAGATAPLTTTLSSGVALVLQVRWAG